MKLYNQTKIPDSILKQVLYHAAKNIGSVRTANVVVLVRQHGGCSFAHRGNPYRAFLEGKKRKNGKWPFHSIVRSDAGWIKINLSRHLLSHPGLDPLEMAECVYKTAAHEWRHIRDFQKGERFGDYHKHHDSRPHEIRANSSAEKAMRLIPKRDGCSDAILELAVILEQFRKK